MLTPVPPGEIATVVTHLSLDAPLAGPVPASPFQLRRWAEPEPQAFRDLFARVGGRWLWYSRLMKTEEQLRAILTNPANEIYRVWDRDAVLGFAELHFSQPKTAELTFLGFVPEFTGRGHGQWLLAATLAQVWARPGVRRVLVNTCTLDHPAALPNYLRAGFRVIGRSVETFPDPRLSGVLPPEEAPQAPPVVPESWR